MRVPGRGEEFPRWEASRPDVLTMSEPGGTGVSPCRTARRGRRSHLEVAKWYGGTGVYPVRTGGDAGPNRKWSKTRRTLAHADCHSRSWLKIVARQTIAPTNRVDSGCTYAGNEYGCGADRIGRTRMPAVDSKL